MKKINLLKGLRAKLIVYFLIISMVPSAIIAVLSYNNSRKSLRQQAIDELTVLRDEKKQDIEEYFKSGKSRISYMSQEPIVIEAMTKFIQTPINSTDYNSVYNKYNSTFTDFVNKMEKGDILLADSKTGNVLYSTLKEQDYGANLLADSYKNTNVGRAFQNCRNSNDKNFTTITDYEFYAPSNNKPIACIAAPIFNGDEKVGVLIFKLGTERIDEIVSNNNSWEDMNLGKTGEILLIGKDYKLRNNSRFLNSETDEKIKAAKSTILLKEIKTKAAEDVLDGKTNVDTYFDYNNNRCIIAYTPLNIDELKWGISVKIDQSEAFKPINELQNLMLIVLIVAVLAIISISFVIASNIASPMIKMSKIAHKISEGDLTIKMPEEKRSDEIGILINSFANMLEQLRKQTKEITNVVNVIAASVSEITVSLTQVTSGAAQTSSAVSETTSTVEEVKQTVHVSSEKTKSVSNTAKQSVEISEEGVKATEETIAGMSEINNQMQAIAESILALSEQSQNISDIIESVENLSEQSNILAVNASIEAAKAGEQGKGFSIVAHEIRNLADQSKQGIRRVRNILKDIQKATNTAVMTTEKGIKLVETGMSKASEAGNAIEKLMENITISAQSAVQIEASSQQQLIGMDQVAIAMEGINEASIQNVDSMKQLEEATNNLQEMGERLKQLIEQYNV